MQEVFPEMAFIAVHGAEARCEVIADMMSVAVTDSLFLTLRDGLRETYLGFYRGGRTAVLTTAMSSERVKERPILGSSFPFQVFMKAER